MALQHERGIIFDIQPDYILVATPGMEFVSIPPRQPVPRLGEEVEFVRATQQPSPLLSWLPTILAAAVVLFVMVAGVWTYGLTPAALAQPTYYLAMDINPSWELGINHQGTVVALRAVNADAASFPALPVEGMSVPQALHALLAEAQREGFLEPGSLNYLAFSVVDVPNTRRHSTPKPLALHDVVRAQLASMGILDTYIEVFRGSYQQRQLALEQGVSLNRVLAQASLSPYEGSDTPGDVSIRDLLAALRQQGNLQFSTGEELPPGAPRVDSWQPTAPAQGPDSTNSNSQGSGQVPQGQPGQSQGSGSTTSGGDNSGDAGAPTDNPVVSGGDGQLQPVPEPTSYQHLVLKPSDELYPGRPTQWSVTTIRRFRNRQGWVVSVVANPTTVNRKDWVYVTVVVRPPEQLNDEPLIVYLEVSVNRGNLVAGAYQEVSDAASSGFRFFVNPADVEGTYILRAVVGTRSEPQGRDSTTVVVSR